MELLFPTPVYIVDLQGEELEKVQAELLAVYEKTEFNHKPGWDGRHSLSDITFTKNILGDENCEEFGKVLDKYLTHYVSQICSNREYKLRLVESWMTLTRKGESAHAHNHATNTISGAYYIKTNGQDGHISFINPNSGLSCSRMFMDVGNDIFVPAQVGRLILFPSFLVHSVDVNTTDNDRVSLSFNLKEFKE